MWKKLHPKIATSEKHAKFGFSPFTLWTMMLPHTDTAGRYWANAAYIKGQCLPLFDHVRLEQVEEALKDLERVGLIHLFDVGGKRYLVYHDSAEHNPTGGLKFQRPEWPAPPDGICGCLSRRDNAVVTAASPLSSFSSPPKPPDEPPSEVRPAIRHLHRRALEAKIPGRKETLLSYLESWTARTDAGRVEQILMDPWTRGKTVVEIQDHFFPKNAEKDAAFAARRDANGPRKV